MATKTFKNLSGKILVASPYVLHGNMFHKSLIYILSHGEDGSVGLIINYPIDKTPFKSILGAIIGNEKVINNELVPVYLGGPIDSQKIFFIHSNDYEENILFKFHDDLVVSSNSKILDDIAEGHGPKNAMLMIGYTAWEAGQLEEEFEDNLWIVSDYHKDLLFGQASDDKWQVALHKLGIDNAQFVSQLGHC